jgi:hypothetical protein
MSSAPEESVPISAVTASFFPDGGQPFDDASKAQALIPRKLQDLGALTLPLEMQGILAGLPHGYVAEIVGRTAAAGEQLGLAFTAVRDAEVWLWASIDPEQESRRAIAGRALAEAAGLWSISAGHAAANVVARIIRAHKGAVYLDKALGWNGWPAPFVETRETNLSLNKDTVKKLRRAARETGEGSLVDLAEPLGQLVAGDAWVALEERRHVGYHRWRPQSLVGGVATINPWVDHGDGTLSMEAGHHSGHTPPTLKAVVTEAREGYDALSDAMEAVLQAFAPALASVGVRAR